MGVLFMGGEHLDFSNPQGGNFVTTGARVTAFRRGTIGVNSNQLILAPFTDPMTGASTSSLEFWFTARLDGNNYYSIFDWDGIGFQDASTAGYLTANDRLKINYGAGNGILTITKYNSSGSATVMATASNPYYVTQRTDIYVKRDSVSGSVKVYIDGVLRASASGDTMLNNSGGFDRVSIRGGAEISEVIAHTSDTRNMRLITLSPSASGDVNTFTSGTYADIDEAGSPNASYGGADILTDYLTTNSTGTQASFRLSVPPTASAGRGPWTVHAVSAVTNANATADAAAQNIQVGLRISGTMYLSGQQALQVGSLDYRKTFELNPYTSASWQATQLSGTLQIAMQTA